MRPEKTAFVNQIREELEGSEFVILADYLGLSVAQSEELRNRLAGVEGKLRIIKNSMLLRVAGDLNYDVGDELSGPTAMVFGTGDVVQTAKVIKDFVKENKLPEIKLGNLHGKRISAADVNALADMPSLDVMRGKLVGTIAAPMTQLVGVFQQKVASLVYVLKAVQDKKENS
jgi:large subunit ribosomal protein L10